MYKRQGQYLWQPSLTAGAPDLLLGKPVRTSAYMPAIAAEMCIRDRFEIHRSVRGKSSRPKSRNQIVKWLKAPHSDSAEYKMWPDGDLFPVGGVDGIGSGEDARFFLGEVRAFQVALEMCIRDRRWPDGMRKAPSFCRACAPRITTVFIFRGPGCPTRGRGWAVRWRACLRTACAAGWRVYGLIKGI